MLILSLESSAGPASVAVYKHGSDGGGKLLGQHYRNDGFSHSRTLLAMAESLLRDLGIKPADLDLIAVVNGPGSFTGIRIGVSAAKGLAFGLDVPVCPVSTLEAMAYQAVSTDALICPVMDARRSQVYNALFKWDNGSIKRLRDDRAIAADELIEDLLSYKEIPNTSSLRPPSRNPTTAVAFMPVGDGTDLLLAKATGIEGLAPILPSPSAENQSALGVALASLHAAHISASALEPVYLRPSQAERERSKTGG